MAKISTKNVYLFASLLLTDPLKVLKTIAVDAIEKELSDRYNKMDLCCSYNDLISCV